MVQGTKIGNFEEVLKNRKQIGQKPIPTYKVPKSAPDEKKKKKKSVDGFPPVSSRKTENLLEGLGQCLKGDAKKTVSTALSSCIALYNTPHFDWLREVLSLRPHLAHDDKKWVFFLTTTSHCQ